MRVGGSEGREATMERRLVLRAVAVSIAIGFVLTLTPLDAAATFPGRDGSLAFQRNGDIWIGHGNKYVSTWVERRLTFNGISDDPRWSSTGTRLVYDTQLGDVWTMSPTGEDRRRVVTGGASQPAWSPKIAGTQRLVFVRVASGRPGDLWTVPAWGGTPTRLTYDGAGSCGDSWPSWSPNGSKIVYQRSPRLADGTCGPSKVVVLTLATMRRRIVPLPQADANGDAFNADWDLSTPPDFSADGSRILFGTIFADWCEQYLGWYDVASRTSSAQDMWYGCEGGEGIVDAGTIPSGGFWLEWNEWNGPTQYIQYPWSEDRTTGSSTYSAVKRWSSPDVQPVP
jgi:WD40-like Beta Propeller Repeat